jgi:hypothetical protein
VIGAFGAVFVSLVAWLVQNSDSANPMLVFVTIPAIEGLSIAIVASVYELYRCYNSLEGA